MLNLTCLIKHCRQRWSFYAVSHIAVNLRVDPYFEGRKNEKERTAFLNVYSYTSNIGADFE